MNMETLCLETQLIAYAATPFVDFNKLDTKKVNWSDSDIMSKEEYEAIMMQYWENNGESDE